MGRLVGAEFDKVRVDSVEKEEKGRNSLDSPYLSRLLIQPWRLPSSTSHSPRQTVPAISLLNSTTLAWRVLVGSLGTHRSLPWQCWELVKPDDQFPPLRPPPAFSFLSSFHFACSPRLFSFRCIPPYVSDLLLESTHFIWGRGGERLEMAYP